MDLKGGSTGAFSAALASWLGAQAEGLSASPMSRLKAKGLEDQQRWQPCSRLGKRYGYVWADRLDCHLRQEDDRQCLLVSIGGSDNGSQARLGLDAGFHESAWQGKRFRLRLPDQGHQVSPALAMGVGALGCWQALSDSFPTTRVQRCWGHKTAKVLNHLPKRQQPQAKAAFHESYLAATTNETATALHRG